MRTWVSKLQKRDQTALFDALFLVCLPDVQRTKFCQEKNAKFAISRGYFYAMLVSESEKALFSAGFRVISDLDLRREGDTAKGFDCGKSERHATV